MNFNVFYVIGKFSVKKHQVISKCRPWLVSALSSWTF